MQTARHDSSSFPDVTDRDWAAAGTSEPSPGTPQWEPPSRAVPNPGNPGWEPPSNTIPNPGGPGWEPPSDLMDLESAARDRAGAKLSDAAPPRRVVIAVASAIALFVLLYAGGTASLSRKLESSIWTRYEDSLELELDFDGDTIDYNVDALFFSTTIARIDYKVVSPFGMVVSFGGDWRYISVKIDDGILVLSPAITQPADSEYWF